MILAGVARVDYRAIAALAAPLMLNSSLQAVISLTDTWFVGHISTTAMAGMAAVYWVILLFLMLIGGVGLAVQTFVAQAEGSRRYARASHATWVALWASVLTVPLYALLAWSGDALFAPFGLAPDVPEQAMAFWQPRMLGAPLGVALWAILGFFNGISQPRIAVMTTVLVGDRERGAQLVFHLRARRRHRRLGLGHERQHGVRRGVRARRSSSRRSCGPGTRRT